MNDTANTISRSSRAEIVDPVVDLEGGQYGAGLLSGVSLISRGEAQGHGFWIDQDLLAALASVLQEKSHNGDGIKSRYTHPFASADSLGRYLGRVTAADPQTTARGLAEGWIPVSVHLAKSSRRTPEGDLGGYVMGLAVEDDHALGLSAVFRRDSQAELDYMLAHGGDLTTGPDGQQIVEGFQSPDALNVNNLPHARLAELRAADIVGDPAANPHGLRGPVAGLTESREIWRYALGLTDQRPTLVALDVDPDRLRGHLAELLKSENLTLKRSDETMTRKTTTGMASADASLGNPEAATEETAEQPTSVATEEKTTTDPEASATALNGDVEPIEQDEPATEPTAETEPATEPTAETEPATEPESQPQTVQLAAADLKQWQQLGPNAMTWLAEGKSLAEATALRLAEQDAALAERDEQVAQLSAAAAASRGESEPVSSPGIPVSDDGGGIPKPQDRTSALAAELDEKIQRLNQPSGN